MHPLHLRVTRWILSDTAITLLVIASLLLLQLPFRLLMVSMADEGVILQIADDLRRGHHLYVDAVHYALPGVFYLTAAAFALFGTSVETARSLTIFLFAATCGIAYLISRWWYTRRGALAVVGLFLGYRVWAYPHWQMLSYSTLAVTLVLLATWLVGSALAHPRGWHLSLAGMVAGTAVLAKQDSGATTVAALGLTLLVCRPAAGETRLRRMILFATGCGLVLGIAGAAIWLGGFGADLIRETILAPLYAVGHFDHLRRPALFPLLGQSAEIRRDPWNYFPAILVDLYWSRISGSALYQQTPIIDLVLKVIYYLPWLLLVAVTLPTILALRRRPPDVGRQRLLLIALVTVGFLAAFNPPQDWVHLLVLYPPILLLGAAFLAGLRLPRAVAVGIGSAVLVATASSALMATSLLGVYRAPVYSPRGVLYARPEQAAPLASIVAELAAGAHDTPLLTLPYDPMLNFLTARPGLSRFYLVWPVEREPHRDEQVVQRLEENPGANVVYTPNGYPGFPRLAAYAPGLFGYLADHYTIDRVFDGGWDGFTFFSLRRRERPAGESLLGDELSSAEVAVVSEGRPPHVVLDGEREKLVGEALWPFNRVLRVTVVPDQRVTVRYHVTPLAGDRFEASFGVNPDQFTGAALPNLRFTVSLQDIDGEHELAAQDVTASNLAIASRWGEMSVDLSSWAGHSVELVLAVGASAQAPAETAGWGAPRIIRRTQ